MDKELRNKITTTISQYLSHFESYTNGSRLDRPPSIDAFFNSINDLYQSYYAVKVKDAVNKSNASIYQLFNQYIGMSLMSDFEKFQWQSLKGGK